MENWKDVPGYEGSYMVSDLGSIKSLDRTVTRYRNGKAFPWKLRGKILNPVKGQVNLWRNDAINYVQVYQIVASVFPNEDVSLPGEIWQSILGYEGFYEVSNMGRFKSLARSGVRMVGGKMRPYTQLEFIRKPTYTRQGYERVTLSIDDKPKTFFAHVIVAKTFIPNPENKPEVNHIDGNKINNHVSNLEWCTRLENVRHAIETGLYAKRQARKILTDDLIKVAFSTK